MAKTKLLALGVLMTLGLTACGAAYDPGSLKVSKIFEPSRNGNAAVTVTGGPAPAANIKDTMDGERQTMQRLDDDDAVVTRFQTLRRLLDEGLITREEYDSRRANNLGALLPYTVTHRPAAGLSRPAPAPEQIVQRLKALAAAYQEQSLSAADQTAERATILDNLLPPASARRADRSAPVDSQTDAASAIGRLDRMREASVITQAEMTKERRMIMASAAAGEARRAAAARLASGMTPVTSPIGPGIQLATVGSEAQAQGLWEAMLSKYPDQLSGLQPSIKRVAQRHRPARYVLSAGSLPDRKSAQALCRTLKAKGQSCSPTNLR